MQKPHILTMACEPHMTKFFKYTSHCLFKKVSTLFSFL